MTVYAVSRESKRIFVFHKGRLEVVQRICAQHNARRPNAAFLPLYNHHVYEHAKNLVSTIRYINRVANEFKRTMFMCTDLEAMTLSDLTDIEDVHYYRVASNDRISRAKAEEGQTDFRFDTKSQHLGMCLCIYNGKWTLGELIELGPQLRAHREGKFNGPKGSRSYQEEMKRRMYRGMYGGFADWHFE